MKAINFDLAYAKNTYVSSAICNKKKQNHLIWMSSYYFRNAIFSNQFEKNILKGLNFYCLDFTSNLLEAPRSLRAAYGYEISRLF